MEGTPLSNKDQIGTSHHELDALAVGKAEGHVVVEDSVHVLNPQCVNRPVEHRPSARKDREQRGVIGRVQPCGVIGRVHAENTCGAIGRDGTTLRLCRQEALCSRRWFGSRAFKGINTSIRVQRTCHEPEFSDVSRIVAVKSVTVTHSVGSREDTE